MLKEIVSTTLPLYIVILLFANMFIYGLSDDNKFCYNFVYYNSGFIGSYIIYVGGLYVYGTLLSKTMVR